MKNSGPNLQVITSPTLDAYGDPVAPFALSVSDGILHANFSIANMGDADWNSGDPALFPERYAVIDGKYALNNLVEIRIDNGVKVRPVLYDAGDTLPLPGSGAPQESSTFDGFWLSKGWVNLTTDNNVATIDGAAGDVVLGAISTGSHKCDLIIDPDNATGQFATYSLFFDVTAASLVMRTALKTKGRK